MIWVIMFTEFSCKWRQTEDCMQLIDVTETVTGRCYLLHGSNLTVRRSGIYYALEFNMNAASYDQFSGVEGSGVMVCRFVLGGSKTSLYELLADSVATSFNSLHYGSNQPETWSISLSSSSVQCCEFFSQHKHYDNLRAFFHRSISMKACVANVN